MVLTESRVEKFSPHIHIGLVARIKRILGYGGSINFVRLFSQRGYFISDSEGVDWSHLPNSLTSHLEESDNNEDILNIAVAQDGSWVVIRTTRFNTFGVVSDNLKRRLKCFYEAQAAEELRKKEEMLRFLEWNELFTAEQRTKQKEEKVPYRRTVLGSGTILFH